MWQLMICISFISLSPSMFAGRLNNTLLCLYQRVILGIQKRNSHQRAYLAWFSIMIFRRTKAGGLVLSGDPSLGNFRDFRKGS